MPIRYIDLVSQVTSTLPPYPIVESQGVPWTPLTKPLADCTLKMLASAGVHCRTDPPFQSPNDLTFRLIDSAADAAALTPSHPAPIRRPALADVNVVFPVERLRELQADGLFRALAPHHVSILGAIKEFRALHYDMAPAIAAHARAEGADLLLLVPM
jgi:D-proline reductase (dithiol) PrdB